VSLLRISEALERLEIPPVRHRARWLRRYLRRREDELGRVLLARVGRGRRRPTYAVDLRAVRAHAPELLRDDERREADVLRGELARLLDRLHGRVDALEANQAALAEAFRRLSRRAA